MSLNFDEINVLGQIINDTYGKSSTGEGRYKNDPTNASVAIKASLEGNKMHLMAITIKNLGPHNQQHKAVLDCENELNQYLSKYVSECKKEFKKLTGRALVCKQIKESESTDIEIINHYAATRASYVRRRVSYEIQ